MKILAAALLPLVATPLLAAAAVASQSSPETMHLYLTDDGGRQLKVPMFAESSAPLAVARVGSDDVITVRELNAALTAAHESMTKETQAGHKDFAKVLDRMVDVRLVLLDAREMGLAELPEVKEAIAAYEKQAQREALQARALATAKPDPKLVQSRYRAAVKEWKVHSVLFTAEADAKAFAAAAKDAATFDALAAKAVADHKARGGEKADFVRTDKMLPPVVAALEKATKGVVGAPLKLESGWAVMLLEDVRYPEDAKAKADAEAAALADAKKRALKKYYAGLVKRYVKVDEALLKKLDFDAPKPGLASYKKDKRALVRIEGSAPITVGEVATRVEGEFYHGVETAQKSKKVNPMKLQQVDAMISERIVPMEARRLGVDKTPEYQHALKQFRMQVLFTSYVEKAIFPGVKVKEEDARKYYEQHKEEFTLPAMYTLQSLSFREVKAAQGALDGLRSGSDFEWLRRNADGQLPEGEREVSLDASTVSVRAMPKDLAELLEKSKAGDYRLWAGPKKQYHVLRVSAVTPSAIQPFAEVRPKIEERLSAQLLAASIKDTADKLRKVHPVKVYLTRIGT